MNESKPSVVWVLSKGNTAKASYSNKEKATQAFKRNLMIDFYWGNDEKLMTEGYPPEFSVALNLLCYKDLCVYPLPLF